MKVDLEGVEWRRELRPQLAVNACHDGAKNLGQRLALIVIPKLLDVGSDALIEYGLSTGFQANPAGVDLDFFVFGHNAVVGTLDGGDSELARQQLLSGHVVGVNAIGRGVSRTGRRG